MKILAGIHAPSRPWELLLEQEGLPWRAVDLSVGSQVDECSVLIITRVLSASERAQVERYLHRGGAILGGMRHGAGVCGMVSRKERLEYLVSDGDDVFRSAALVDLGVRGAIPREAQHLRTSHNTFAVFAGRLSGGAAVFLPFDLHEVMTDTRALVKSFSARWERLPSERVSLVGKGEVRMLIHDALEYLHHVRGYPYVHLWYYPALARNVVALRIDTDGAPREDIDALYHVVRTVGGTATWFLDVQAHEQWIEHFKTMVGQEIALHCYEHRVLDKRDVTLEQLRKGVRVLESVGLRPQGFAAPFGHWSVALAHSVEQLGFRYSSEFSYVYDSLPTATLTHDRLFSTVQIPVHPICIGSLLRVGYSAARMKQYYRDVTVRHSANGQPLFFYHHPSHESWDVVSDMLTYARQSGAQPMTLGAYAQWWSGRNEAHPFFAVDAHQLCIEPADQMEEKDLGVRVSLADGREALLPPKPATDLQTLFYATRKTVPPPADIRRIREFDPRRMLGEVYNSMLRRIR